MKKSFFYYLIKRLFDFVSSLALFLFLSPILLLILIINVFAVKGNPLYVDKRVGKNGKELNLLKVRSMFVDAETHPEKYFTEEQLTIWKKERKVDNDPRITKFGKFLRKTSLDELPQLLNIIAGSMSVVGPRPITVKELELNYNEEERVIFISARPGLISNWGVNGRNEVDYKSGERQKLELDYLNKRSIWYDLGLVFKAIGVVISCKGAK